MKKERLFNPWVSPVIIAMFLQGWFIPINDGITAVVGAVAIFFVSIAIQLLINKFAKKHSEENSPH